MKTLNITGTPAKRPGYVYVASSWRNPMQPMVCEILRAAGIDHYDFRNPEGSTGFGWSQVKSDDDPASRAVCEHCDGPIARSTFAGLGFMEPDYDPDHDPVAWRHTSNGYGACFMKLLTTFATPKKGSDWEAASEYLSMVSHPRALAGFASDFAAMVRADTFIMVLPCGKSAHLELGWAAGAGKRTAVLLEDPIEPELMYRCADLLTTSTMDLLAWLGVES